MNVKNFDRWIQNRIGSQLHRLLRGVAKRDRRNALADVWLVLEGDWGGQIYLSVPWLCLGRNARIGELLRKMDALAWGCNALDGASVRLVRPRTNKVIESCVKDAGCSLQETAAAYGFDSIDEFMRSSRMFVAGGMGGGQLSDGSVWLHDEFLGRPVCVPEARDVLDEIRGATDADIRRMDWISQAFELLDLRRPTH